MPDTAGHLDPRKHDDALVMHKCTFTRRRRSGAARQIHAIAPSRQHMRVGWGFLIPTRVRENTEGVASPARRGNTPPSPWERPRRMGEMERYTLKKSRRGAGKKESLQGIRSQRETGRKKNRRKPHIISMKSPGRNSLFVEWYLSVFLAVSGDTIALWCTVL